MALLLSRYGAKFNILAIFALQSWLMNDGDTFTVFNLKYNIHSDQSHAQFQGSKTAFASEIVSKR